MSSTDHAQESVACNLCGGTETRLFTVKQAMSVVTCVECGLVYVNPRLSEQRLHEHYNSGCSSRIGYYLAAESADRKSFTTMLKLARESAPSGRTLLDIGPNIGTCLNLAREHGWDTHGIEINEEAARYCREQRGLNVRGGCLDENTFPQSSFDVILMGDVIEHLRDPLSLMKIVCGLLRPEGVVVISTPNIAGWAGRALQIKPEEHLYYFSPATMTNLLAKAGLATVAIQSFDRHHNLTAMEHSTTFGGLLQTLSPVFRLSRKLMGDLVVRLPLGENLLAVGRRTAASQESSRPQMKVA